MAPAPIESKATTMRIHFIGVGKMGLPMARHLQGQGHDITVTDLSAERLQQASLAGLRTATLTAADHDVTLVISSLPHDDALRVTAGELSQSMRSGTCFMDTSTVSPDVSAEVAQVMVDAGIDYLRVTLSGNNTMAAAAQLTSLVSGPREVYDALRPVVSAWGPTTFYLGAGEQARLMKLVVNLMILQTTAMLAEALTLGEEGGLQWEDMWDVFAASAVASPILKAKAVPLRRRDFTPTFTVRQMMKDAGLMLDAGERLGQPLTLTRHAMEQLRQADALGHGERDYAALIVALNPDMTFTSLP